MSAVRNDKNRDSLQHFEWGGVVVARKWLALLLVALGLVGLLPYLQDAVALSQGTVKGHSTDRSSYAVTGMASNNQLVACQGGPIIIQRNTTMPVAFKCWTNYDAPVDLTWEVANLSDPLIASASTPTPVTLKPTDTNTNLCRPAQITAKNVSADTTNTVIFKGKSTSTTADFYVEIYFPVTVTVQKSNKGTGYTCQ